METRSAALQNRLPGNTFRWLAPTLTLVLWIAGLLPITQNSLYHLEDLLTHFLGFVLLILVYREGFGLRSLPALLGLALLIGGTLELLQTLVPYRDASVMDLAADLFGALVAGSLPDAWLPRLWRVLATFLGVGYLRPGPGTLASGLTVLLYLGTRHGPAFLWVLAVPVALLTVALGNHLVASSHDPSWFVLDEVAGTLVALALVPRMPGTILLALLAFRVLDILKPGPIRQAETLPRGWGILADDLLAGLAAGLGVRLLALLSLAL